MSAPLLSLDDLVLEFGAVRALDHVSVDVRPGELLALIGPNGAGKSSLFNCISGVYRPTSGQVWLDGVDLRGRRAHQIARLGVARTFQNLELFAGMSVVQNLMLGRHRLMRGGMLSDALGFGRSNRQEAEHRLVAERIMDLLGLTRFRSHEANRLPYGIQKRVEMARALCMEPRLFLLDEPVAGMNLEEREDMARAVLDVHRELGIGIVLVEHDMGLVMDIADRVAVLDFGRLLTVGTPRDVQQDPQVIRAYIGAAESSGTPMADVS